MTSFMESPKQAFDQIGCTVGFCKLISASSTGAAAILLNVPLLQQQLELSEKSVHNLYVRPIWSLSST